MREINSPATARAKARYDRIAPIYDFMQGVVERLVFRKLRRLLWQDTTGENLLEVGVGTGKNIKYYPPQAQVTAVDFSQRMLKKARRRAEATHRAVDLRKMDIQALDFSDAAFDTVVASFVFCSVPDPVLGLQELSRVTKPNGRILLLEHMRPESRLIGRLFDLINPVLVRLLGFNINRRTVDNIRSAGLGIEVNRKLDPSGIMRLFILRPSAEQRTGKAPGSEKTDPVCGMRVDKREAIVAESRGELVYFCSEGCRERFLENHPLGPRRGRYELVIIGGGPAGLTAAVYAATMKLDAFIITRDLGGQAIDSTKIENYMGYDFITGPELIAKFRDQLVHSQYIDHLISEVERVEPTADGFMITSSEGDQWHAKSVIVATGMTRRKLQIPGEEQFQRKGIFYGNVQDYSFVQGEDVAVIGGGNSALQMAESLRTVAKEIHLISDFGLSADRSITDRIMRFPNVHVYESCRVLGFTGRETVSGISIRRRSEAKDIEIPVRGVFVAIGLQPASGLVAKMVDLNDRSEIVIGANCATSRSGLFAAGDVTNASGKRIIIASGEGAKAALAARKHILSLRRERGNG